MSRRAALPYAALARLQELAALERRRLLEQACADTDRCEAAVTSLNGEMAAAEQGYADASAGPGIDLPRMTVAAAVLMAGERALSAGLAAADSARTAESGASLAWLQARHRVDWLREQDRGQQRAQRSRADDRADAEARAVRLRLPGEQA